MPIPLSPEIYAQVVHSACSTSPLHTKRNILRVLCLTCKAFRREAEPRLYEILNFSDAQKAKLLCHTVIRFPTLGAHIRSFSFSQTNSDFTIRDAFGGGQGRLLLGQGFWAAMHGALGTMRNLESLVLIDLSYANSWVLNGLEDIDEIDEEDQFAGRNLTQANLRFTWDEHVARFLERQKKLFSVTLKSPECDSFHATLVTSGSRTEPVTINVPLSPSSLPLLRQFDGSLDAVLEVVRVSSSLSNVQAFMHFNSFIPSSTDNASDDSLNALEKNMRAFARVSKTLRSINLLEMPEEASGRIVSLLGNLCPGLLYLGLLRLPAIHRGDFFSGLISLKLLRHIQLDISGWLPHPNTSAQRVLAAELKTFCPSLHYVVFWYHTSKFSWKYTQENWNYQVESHQYPHKDRTWGTV